MKTKWTKEEMQILTTNYGKILSKEIQKLLPTRSVVAISIKAKELGLKGDPSITRRIYGVNDNYFNAPSNENCYWAGFIAADGNIHSKKKRLLRLKLQEKDKNHLEKYIKCLNFSGHISTITKIKHILKLIFLVKK